jgi:hypothetical protein
MTRLKWLVTTKLGWLLISFVWASVFLIIDDNIESDWAMWAATPALGYMFGLTIVGTVFAWIINPLRDREKLSTKNEEH